MISYHLQERKYIIYGFNSLFSSWTTWFADQSQIKRQVHPISDKKVNNKIRITYEFIQNDQEKC